VYIRVGHNHLIGDLFQLPALRRCTILQGNLLGSPKCADSGHVFLFTAVILLEPAVTQLQRADLLFTALLNRLRIGIMMGDDVQFLNTTRFGAPAAGSRRSRQPSPQSTAQLCMWYSRAHSSTRLFLLGATHGHGRPLLRK
jgi:hypothetical protein